MRKLKLESLQVQSFATTPAGPASRGTVQAHAESAGGGCVSLNRTECLETGPRCNPYTVDCTSSLLEEC